MKLPILESFNMQRIPSYFTIVACKEKQNDICNQWGKTKPACFSYQNAIVY